MEIFLCIFVCVIFSIVACNDIVPDRKCATLYSEENVENEAFTMRDFDQAVDTQKDYRVSVDGWQMTGSVVVENECQMYICNRTYFDGTCIPISHSDSPPSPFLKQIRSANCTCSRECSCNDVLLSWNSYGRAYLNGGCRKCNSEYFDLTKPSSQSFHSDGYSFEAFVIRAGCNLIIYSEIDFEGGTTIFISEINENIRRAFKSYLFICNETAFVPRVSENRVSGSTLIKIPNTAEKLIKLYTSNSTLADHPGINAALNSLASGRSWRNSYTLLIGSKLTDNCGLSNFSSHPLGTIWECRTPTNLEHLGISNTEVRYVFYQKLNGGFLHPMDSDELSRLLASFDVYFSNHSELKYAIPNAVVIHQSSLALVSAVERLKFEQKLEILNYLRTRILDENYPNVIFLIDGTNRRHNTESTIAQFEKIIGQKFAFPKPFFIVGADTDVSRYPMKLNLITKKSGDELGLQVLKQDSATKIIQPQYTVISQPLLSLNHSKVVAYKEFMLSQDNKTNKDSAVVQVFSESVATIKAVKMLDMKYKVKTARLQKANNDLVSRVQVLEHKLAEQNANRDLENKRIKGEIEDEIKSTPE